MVAARLVEGVVGHSMLSLWEMLSRWEPLGSAPEKSDLLPKYALAANNPTLQGIGDKGSGDVVGGGGATEAPGHMH